MGDTYALRESIYLAITEGLGEQPTLRDQFAMAALTGQLALMAHPESKGPPDSAQIPIMSASCYRIADAMLLARIPSKQPVQRRHRMSDVVKTALFDRYASQGKTQMDADIKTVRLFLEHIRDNGPDDEMKKHGYFVPETEIEMGADYHFISHLISRLSAIESEPEP